MGSLFGGNSGGGGGSYQAPAPQVQRAPVRQAPSGPQLAPGQSTPGGPVTVLPVETEEERRRRLLAAQANATILGDSFSNGMGGDGSAGGAASAGDGGDGGGGGAAP